jgi:hypothetical protein
MVLINGVFEKCQKSLDFDCDKYYIRRNYNFERILNEKISQK